jgi:ABC-2 type transport system permease protein
MTIETRRVEAPGLRVRPATLRSAAGPFWGFVERQANLYKRFWAWEVVWFIYSVVSVASIGYLASGLGDIGVNGAAGTGTALKSAQLYLLAGSLLWSYLSLVFMEVAYAIAWERWEGTIEYTFMAPVKRVTHLFGICAFSVAYGLARTLLVALVCVPLFGVDLSHSDLLSALAVLLLATPALVGLGILVAIMPLLAPEKGEQMSMAIQGVLLLVSGVYYPVSVLPLPLRVLGNLSPLTPMLDAIRQALIHGVGVVEVLPQVAELLGLGAALVAAGLWLFSRAERRAKRLGLLKRTG